MQGIKKNFFYIFLILYLITGSITSLNIGISHDELHEEENWKYNVGLSKNLTKHIFLDQEIRNFPLVGNAWCLITAMRTASGQNLNYQPYSDGKFDLLLNGKKIRDRISATELLSIAKSLR